MMSVPSCAATSAACKERARNVQQQGAAARCSYGGQHDAKAARNVQQQGAAARCSYGGQHAACSSKGYAVEGGQDGTRIHGHDGMYTWQHGARGWRGSRAACLRHLRQSGRERWAFRGGMAETSVGRERWAVRGGMATAGVGSGRWDLRGGMTTIGVGALCSDVQMKSCK
jgi:hypothetical protein